MSLRILAHVLLVLAIAVSPLAMKIPVGPVAVCPCDLVMLLAATSFLASFARGGASVAFAHSLRTIRPTLPLISVNVLSAVAAGNVSENLTDVVQIGLYAGTGVWVGANAAAQPGGAARIRGACAVALVIAGVGLVLDVFGAARATEYFGFTAPLSWTAACFAALYIAVTPRRRGWRAVFARGALLTCALCALLVAPPRLPVGDAPVAQLDSPVPQRYIEAFAACTVAARRPLLGLGPANYQAHIGEYYGVLPKANTMAPRTQVGYGVVLASLGLLGLAALLHWLFTLYAWVRATRPVDLRLLLPLGVLAAAGLCTPLFVTQLLAPLAALHALVWARYTGLCSD